MPRVGQIGPGVPRAGDAGAANEIRSIEVPAPAQIVNER
jgi:hypothetical protein